MAERQEWRELIGKNADEVLSLGTDKSRNSAKDFIVGLELEIESIADYFSTNPNVMVTDDGSLRNNGREFLTAPGSISQAMERFNHVHNTIQTIPDVPKFSERTSTHVHVNMLYCTCEEIRALLLYYAIFEELAFRFVAPNRRTNIHCVPLTWTHMPANYLRKVTQLPGAWHKYTAFNLKPLSTLGTVEFRHLEGTSNPTRMLKWLNFLQYLYENCLNSTAKYDDILDIPKLNRMARDCADILSSPTSYNVEDYLLDVKYAYLRSNY